MLEHTINTYDFQMIGIIRFHNEKTIYFPCKKLTTYDRYR